jgi:hypothetical protein
MRTGDYFGAGTGCNRETVEFYFAVPSVDLTSWLVVEAANPDQPMG